LLTGSVPRLGDLAEGDARRGSPRFSSENFEHNRALAARVASLANELHITPAQLALAWVITRGEGVVPIPGTTKQARLDENIAAARVELGRHVLEQLDALAPPGAAAGARYAPAAMHSVNR
jgi:aryl-alcohol dehydrogenase-like predicted oxidoreductase